MPDKETGLGGNVNFDFSRNQVCWPAYDPGSRGQVEQNATGIELTRTRGPALMHCLVLGDNQREKPKSRTPETMSLHID